MKMCAAMAKINIKPAGYMIAFEWINGRFLTSDYFPDKHAGEVLIMEEEEAWRLAKKFAEATKGETCNLYVVAHNFKPVANYRDRRISNR